jgi:hypothetical protein
MKAYSQANRNCLSGPQIARDSRSTSRSIRLIAILIAAIAFPAHLAWSQSRGATGYEVKTAFLFNFAKFIDWPPRSFASPQSPFTICVLGQNPFGNTLDDTLQGKMIGDRPLAVLRLKDKAEARRCQMVFVSSSENAHLGEIIGSLNGASVLLIGEMNGFAALGGTIEFTLDDNHVGFTINTDAVGRSGLKFSSKLLALAKIVHDDGHSKGS